MKRVQLLVLDKGMEPYKIDCLLCLNYEYVCVYIHRYKPIYTLHAYIIHISIYLPNRQSITLSTYYVIKEYLRSQAC